MSDLRDEVYELFNNVGLFFVIACTTLLAAMGNTTCRYVRWVYVGIISIGMPSMPKVSLTSGGMVGGAVGTSFWTAWQLVGNSTWVSERVYDHFKPVNKTLAREQIYEENIYACINDTADWFEKKFPGSRQYIYPFLVFIFNSFYKKIFKERVVVVETAVALPPKKNAPKKNARKKSPAPKRTLRAR